MGSPLSTLKDRHQSFQNNQTKRDYRIEKSEKIPYQNSPSLSCSHIPSQSKDLLNPRINPIHVEITQLILSLTSNKEKDNYDGTDSSTMSSRSAHMNIHPQKVTPSMRDSLAILHASLLCPICNQIFTNPTTLACTHSFCLSCIQEYDVKHWTCPLPGCSMPLSFHRGSSGRSTASSRSAAHARASYLKINPQLNTVVSSFSALKEAIHLAREEWWKDVDADKDGVDMISGWVNDKVSFEMGKLEEDDDEEFVDFQKDQDEEKDAESKNNAEDKNEKEEMEWMTPPEESSKLTKLTKNKESPLTKPKINSRVQNAISEEIKYNQKPDSLLTNTKLSNSKTTLESPSKRIKTTHENLTLSVGSQLGNQCPETTRDELERSARTSSSVGSEHMKDVQMPSSDPFPQTPSDPVLSQKNQEQHQCEERQENSNVDEPTVEDDYEEDENSQTTYGTKTYPSAPSLFHSQTLALTTQVSKSDSPKDIVPETIVQQSNSVEPSPLPLTLGTQSQPPFVETIPALTKNNEALHSTPVSNSALNDSTVLKASNKTSVSKNTVKNPLSKKHNSTEDGPNSVKDVKSTNVKTLKKDVSLPPLILLLSSSVSSAMDQTLQKSLDHHYGNTSDCTDRSCSSMNETQFLKLIIPNSSNVSDGNPNLSKDIYALSIQSEFATGDGYLVSPSFPYLLAVAKGMLIVDRSFLKFHSPPNRNRIISSSEDSSNPRRNSNCVKTENWLFPREYSEIDSTLTSETRSSSKSKLANSASNKSTTPAYHVIGDVKAETWMAPQKARQSRLNQNTIGSSLFQGWTIILCGEFDSLKSRRNSNSRTRTRRNSASRRHFDEKAMKGGHSVSSTVQLEEPMVYTKERVKVLLKLCQAKVLDLNDNYDRTLSDSWASSSLSMKSLSPENDGNVKKIVCLIRSKPNTRDFRLGEKTMNQKFPMFKSEESKFDVPVVSCDWVLDSIANFEIRALDRYCGNLNGIKDGLKGKAKKMKSKSTNI